MENKKAVFSWCLYDWANSAFPTVITTFIFGTYYTKAVAETPEQGTSDWGLTMGIAAGVIAVTGPVLGAIADQGGRRKPWLGVFSALCILATACLWFTEPNAGSAIWALTFVAIATFAFETGMVFYNAMLPDVAPESHWGRISGWGWGLGYVGGLCCLAICLFGFVQTDNPWFGVSKENAANVRFVAIVVAVWFALFVWPLFVFTPDRQKAGVALGAAIRQGVAQLAQTVREARKYAGVGRFLLARMVYTDGLNTLFAFGGIFAAGSFGMSLAEVIQFGIALNVTAGLGAAAFAWLDDKVGAKPVIVIALLALSVLGTAMLLVETKTWFWILGIGLGIFIGPSQAASRSMMARLAPEHVRTEMFGLYALSGKATAFAGPLILAWVTDAFTSQRAGMATIIVFLVTGLLLLLAVKEPKD